MKWRRWLYVDRRSARRRKRWGRVMLEWNEFVRNAVWHRKSKPLTFQTATLEGGGEAGCRGDGAVTATMTLDPFPSPHGRPISAWSECLEKLPKWSDTPNLTLLGRGGGGVSWAFWPLDPVDERWYGTITKMDRAVSRNVILQSHLFFSSLNS